MSKLPVITLAEWRKAEEEVIMWVPPQPKGSLTATQYGELTCRTRVRAQSVLRRMVEAGKVRRELWHRGEYVYFLTKEKHNK